MSEVRIVVDFGDRSVDVSRDLSMKLRFTKWNLVQTLNELTEEVGLVIEGWDIA